MTGNEKPKKGVFMYNLSRPYQIRRGLALRGLKDWGQKFNITVHNTKCHMKF